MQALLQSEFIKKPPRLFLDLFEWSAGDDAWKDDILHCREFREKMVELKNKTDMGISDTSQRIVIHSSKVFSSEQDTTGGRLVERAEYVHQGALAGTRDRKSTRL